MRRIAVTNVMGMALALLVFGCSHRPNPMEAPPPSGLGPIGLSASGGLWTADCDGIEKLCDIGIPLAALMAVLGFSWYAYTYITESRFTNMAMLLLTQATVIFGLGLISEQVAALRFERIEGDHRR